MKFVGTNHYQQQTNYILGEILSGTKEQDTTENLNRRQTNAAM